jgi:hypothetical protein
LRRADPPSKESYRLSYIKRIYLPRHSEGIRGTDKERKMFKYNIELRTYDDYVLNVLKKMVISYFVDICLVGLNHISCVN